MKKIIFICSLSLCSLVSCSDGLVEEFSGRQEVESLTRASQALPMLEFSSFDSFRAVVNKVSKLNSTQDKQRWMDEHFPGFVSVQTVYHEALADAENLGEGKEDYELFKGRYSMLYFPLYKEDAGCYIPMRDLDAAFFVNENCEVKIAGRVVNMKDIEDYETLQELGRAYYSSDSALKVSARIANVESFQLNPNVENVGSVYDSGWKTYGKRKVQLKARKRIVNNRMLFHTEFCFRKKTIVGWVNYSSKSKIQGVARYTIGGAEALRISSQHSERSSHDADYLCRVYFKEEKGKQSYLVPEMDIEVTINYDGVPTPLVYSWHMKAALCEVNHTGTIYPIVPLIK